MISVRISNYMFPPTSRKNLNELLLEPGFANARSKPALRTIGHTRLCELPVEPAFAGLRSNSASRTRSNQVSWVSGRMRFPDLPVEPGLTSSRLNSASQILGRTLLHDLSVKPGFTSSKLSRVSRVLGRTWFPTLLWTVSDAIFSTLDQTYILNHSFSYTPHTAYHHHLPGALTFTHYAMLIWWDNSDTKKFRRRQFNRRLSVTVDVHDPPLNCRKKLLFSLPTLPSSLDVGCVGAYVYLCCYGAPMNMTNCQRLRQLNGLSSGSCLLLFPCLPLTRFDSKWMIMTI